MKKISLLFSFFVLLGSTAVIAQASEQKPAEKIWLNEEKHDFGKIPQGTPVFTWFELKGVGEDLKLEMVQAGCGCTTPEFKAGTYKAGEAVKIKVGFNAAAAGPFNKPITIFYNDGKQKVIFISGEVQSTPSTPAPANQGLAKIKQ
ncbi:MAG: DUF1573 domain-containing protein [Chitinophagaceae bacterium]|jgi:hypothetical protein|nr:DUF1573 domain-containing protein [Chitinophagaceae bacterium]MCU0403268.1 DUF1573 domain-containing protein [Chitinophagaceae bacterium]